MHRGDHDLPLADRACALFGNALLNDLKALAGRIRRVDQLGQEDFLPFIPVSHQIQRRDQLGIDHIQLTHGFQRLFRQSRSFLLEPLSNGRFNGHLPGGLRLCRSSRCFARKPRNIGFAVPILSRQHPEGGYRIHDRLLVGVDNGEIQSRIHGLC